MKNRQIILIVAALIFAIAVWRGCSSSDTTSTGVEVPEQEETVEMPRVVPNAETPAATDPTNAGATAATSEAAPLDMEALRARFGKALNDVGPCLGLNSGGSDQPAEPTLDNWVGAMKADLGEPVLQTEDWNNVQLQVGSEKRRLRVEMDYSGEDRIVRRLHYDRVNPDGTFEPIPLTTEQAEDPSETFVASLESDGEVTRRERAQRIYFAGGEEIIVTERDGRVSDLDMSRNGKTFRCRTEDPSPEACRCL